MNQVDVIEKDDLTEEDIIEEGQEDDSSLDGFVSEEDIQEINDVFNDFNEQNEQFVYEFYNNIVSRSTLITEEIEKLKSVEQTDETALAIKHLESLKISYEALGNHDKFISFIKNNNLAEFNIKEYNVAKKRILHLFRTNKIRLQSKTTSRIKSLFNNKINDVRYKNFIRMFYLFTIDLKNNNDIVDYRTYITYTFFFTFLLQGRNLKSKLIEIETYA
jgi:hypothetical protein